MFPRSTVAAMGIAADDAINSVLLRGVSPMLVRPKKEIAFVAAVTLGGIREVATAWGRICSRFGLTLNITGVYCHACPVVTFGRGAARRDCELADLLVVTDIRKGKRFTRRAALIQAKMAGKKDRVFLAGHSTWKQLDLYQNWYHFDFVDPAYDMRAVDLHVGKDPADWSGTFGVIDSRFSGAPLWTQHLPRPTPYVISSGDPQLGTFIAEMTDGTQSGFGRDATLSLNTDWSKTIELLLRVTYARSFGDKEMLGPTRPPRGTNTIVSFRDKATAISKGDASQFAGLLPPIAGIADAPEREGNGLSVFHVELEMGQD